jgi:hypothetical protein
MRLASKNWERGGKGGFTGVCCGTSRSRRGASFGQVVLGAAHEKRFAPFAIRRRGCLGDFGVGRSRECAAGRAFATGAGSATRSAESHRTKFSSFINIGSATIYSGSFPAANEFVRGYAIFRIRQCSASSSSSLEKCECKNRGARWNAHPAGFAQCDFDSQRAARGSRLF